MKPIYCPDCGIETPHTPTTLPIPKPLAYPKPNDHIKTLLECNNCQHLTLPEEVQEYLNHKRPKKEKEEELTEYVSFINDPPFLVEQVVQEGKCLYCIYNTETKEIQYADHHTVQGIIHEPIKDEEAATGKIKLPDHAEEYGTDAELDNTLSKFIKTWLDIPDRDLLYAVFTIRKSWVYDRFHSLSYSRALGELGTGKSRFLDVLGLLHYKPIATSGALTSAVLFRVINKWKGTIIIDEADRRKSDKADDIQTIINQGYERGRFIMRCDKDDPNKIDYFDVYCPKVLATRGYFQDKATESRCFTTIMQQTNRKNIPPNLTVGFHEETQKLRNKLLLWRMRNYLKIDPDAGAKVELGDIEPRLRQVSTGFVALFAHDEQAVTDFRNYLLDHQKEIVEARSETNEGRIVNAIAELMGEGEPITAARIASQADLKDRQGNLWKGRRVASVMKTLGFPSAVLERKDGVVLRVYEMENDKLKSLIVRYVLDDKLVRVLDVPKRNGVTNVTLLDQTPSIVTNPPQPLSLRSTVTTLQTLHGYKTDEPKGERKEAVFANPKAPDGGDLIRYIHDKKGTVSALEIDEIFPPEIVRESIKKGSIMENPKGQYTVIT